MCFSGICAVPEEERKESFWQFVRILLSCAHTCACVTSASLLTGCCLAFWQTVSLNHAAVVTRSDRMLLPPWDSSIMVSQVLKEEVNMLNCLLKMKWSRRVPEHSHVTYEYRCITLDKKNIFSEIEISHSFQILPIKATHCWTTVQAKGNFSNFWNAPFPKECMKCMLFIFSLYIYNTLYMFQFRCETRCRKSTHVIGDTYTSNSHEYILSKMPFLFSFCSSKVCLHIICAVFAHGKLHGERLAVFMIANFARKYCSFFIFKYRVTLKRRCWYSKAMQK